MKAISYSDIIKNGLWHNNAGLVQLLGLCPLLAISNTAVNALGLGIATTLVLLLSNTAVSLTRHWLRAEIRLPVFVLLIASLVTAVELLMNAFFHELYRILGIFIPLIVTNCAILARAETFASKQDPLRAALDGLAVGLGFSVVLIALGALREIIGQGTLFSQAQLLFGTGAEAWTIQLGADYKGFLLALLPPGAFIGLGILIALKNFIEARNSAL